MKPDLQRLFVDLLAKSINSTYLENSYGIHALLASIVMDLQNKAVWEIRTAVRNIELLRTTPGIQIHHSQFPRLHDLARHTGHVLETLDLSYGTLQSMIENHDRLAATTTTSQTGTDTETMGIKTAQQHRYIRDRLHFYKEAIQGLRLRSISNKDRLQNEIQLSFNIVAQNIATSSVEISKAVQSDSSVMKTIALVSAGFIPMTFIATVFSMSFFVYSVDNEKWNMSSQAWIYGVVAVPFTLVTAVVSYVYHGLGKKERLSG